MGNPVKLFIVEGEDRDYRFVNEMTSCFFKGKFQSKIINLPAAQNIYMLFKQLEKDDFETDVVEILRDTVPSANKKLTGINRQDIDEIYMFFDYDVHQNNIGNSGSSGEALKQMLEFFDNETEQGKLYISYPMVEALYDYVDGSCATHSNCFVDVQDVHKYKNISAEGNPNAASRIDINRWKAVLNIFILRICCLFERKELKFDEYRKLVNPLTIYQKEIDLNDKVFVLSCFPEFLFDYFKSDFWQSNVKIKKFKFEHCPKN